MKLKQLRKTALLGAALLTSLPSDAALTLKMDSLTDSMMIFHISGSPNTLVGPDPEFVTNHTNKKTLYLVAANNNGDIITDWVSIDSGINNLGALIQPLAHPFDFIASGSANANINFGTTQVNLQNSTALVTGDTTGSNNMVTLEFNSGTFDNTNVARIDLYWGIFDLAGTKRPGVFQSSSAISAVPEASEISLALGGIAIASAYFIRRKQVA